MGQDSPSKTESVEDNFESFDRLGASPEDKPKQAAEVAQASPPEEEDDDSAEFHDFELQLNEETDMMHVFSLQTVEEDMK